LLRVLYFGLPYNKQPFIHYTTQSRLVFTAQMQCDYCAVRTKQVTVSRRVAEHAGYYASSDLTLQSLCAAHTHTHIHTADVFSASPTVKKDYFAEQH
jgi:hypothetical protein